jgi:hypothetical protein
MHEAAMTNQTMIDTANATEDPVLSNVRITLAHQALATQLQALTGADAGANFHAWAVWGSKKAGVTIRQEDLDAALTNATQVSALCGALSGVVAASVVLASLLAIAPVSLLGGALLLVGAALGAGCGALVGRAIARSSRSRAAVLVLAGNRLVLDDIGRVTAAFVARFPQAPIAADALDVFLDTLKPGPPERGGQDLLREAFRHYATAANADTPGQKVEHAYFANCLAILNEHIKLQPYIDGSLPFIVSKCVTERMLTFEIGARSLAVAVDVPPLDGVAFPEALTTLKLPGLTEFFAKWSRAKSELVGSKAGNWARLGDRMGYIVNLFRCYHQDAGLFMAPYDDAQIAAAGRGEVPPGKL